jgi:hypothetical protein
MTVPPDILNATLLSTLKLEQAISANLSQELFASKELLRQSAAQFREYQRHHLAKSPPDEAKAQRNAALAERIEAHLKQHEPQPVTTQGEA